MTVLNSGLSNVGDTTPVFAPSAGNFTVTASGNFGFPDGSGMVELERSPDGVSWRGFYEISGAGVVTVAAQAGESFRARLLAASGVPVVSLAFSQ
jgi:hypothetical protein